MAENITIKLSDLRPGIVLPAAIYDGSNSELLLLGKGVRITKANVDRLKNRGVSSVSVDAKFAAQIQGTSSGKTSREQMLREAREKKQKDKEEKARELKRPLMERINRPTMAVYNQETQVQFQQTRERNTELLENFLNENAEESIRNGKAVRGVAVESIEQIMVDMDLFVRLAIDRSEDSDKHHHCLRVSQLAMAIATSMECNRQQIEELGIGCLIYRAGETQISRDLIQAGRELTMIERLEITKNPRRMFETLEHVADLPVGARQVAYQIYERWDGTGYPRQRYGLQIHPLARIASVADVYVALTSARPHRPAFEPYEAVEILLDETKNKKFDPNVIRGLLKTVSLFPIGSYVMLSNGCIGVVMRTNPETFGKPQVQVISDAEGHPVTPFHLDLGTQDLISVTRALAPEAIEDLIELHAEYLARQQETLAG